MRINSIKRLGVILAGILLVGALAGCGREAELEPVYVGQRR